MGVGISCQANVCLENVVCSALKAMDYIVVGTLGGGDCPWESPSLVHVCLAGHIAGCLSANICTCQLIFAFMPWRCLEKATQHNRETKQHNTTHPKQSKKN